MLAQERHELILRSLRRHGRLRVADLVAELGVSAITVRRDLAELDASGCWLKRYDEKFRRPSKPLSPKKRRGTARIPT